MVLGDERKARVYTVEELVEVSPNKGKAYLLMMLKLIRNVILLPFALGYIGKLKGNGTNLYFQAKIWIKKVMFIIPHLRSGVVKHKVDWNKKQ